MTRSAAAGHVKVAVSSGFSVHATLPSECCGGRGVRTSVDLRGLMDQLDNYLPPGDGNPDQEPGRAGL